MHKAKINLISLIFIWSSLLSSCGQNNTITASETTEAWNVDEDGIENRSYKIQSCRDDFQTGPIWQDIENQKASLQESEWIVFLATTHYLEPHNDFSPQMRQLRSIFMAENVELLENNADLTLVIAGKPKDVLSVIRKSCLILGFDMTGFHCECAREQCLAARSCTFQRTPWGPSVAEFRKGLDRIIPDYNPIIGCSDDVNQEFVNDLIVHRTGFRGAQWTVARELYSWKNSTCPTSETYWGGY